MASLSGGHFSFKDGISGIPRSLGYRTLGDERGMDARICGYNPPMQELNMVQQVAVMLLPALFAITVHEAAHAWVAKQLGDRTADLLGRVTFNPLRHIDPVGTVLVPLVTFLLSGFLFGWAKPVPVDGRNLRNPKRDMALVAAAGPGANLLMLLFWALLMRLGFTIGEAAPWFALPMVYMGLGGIYINAILLVLNLLPILPLDGGRVLAGLLPARAEAMFSRLEPWGLLIVLGLLFTGALQVLLAPGLHLAQELGLWVGGLQ